MIVVEILLALGVIGLVGVAFYVGYRIGRLNDEINRDSESTK